MFVCQAKSFFPLCGLYITSATVRPLPVVVIQTAAITATLCAVMALPMLAF